MEKKEGQKSRGTIPLSNINLVMESLDRDSGIFIILKDDIIKVTEILD